MKPPLKRFTPDAYTFWWQQDQLEIELDNVHEARGGELRAMMTVYTERNGTRQLLHQADFNLVSARTRQDAVRSLSQRIDPSEMDWSGALEQVCFLARQRWREGDPLIYLPDYEAERGERFLLRPYVEYGGPTIFFAMGGSGKSLFALALAISVAAGVDVLCGLPAEQRRVAYLDWETEPATHHERLAALCAGIGLPIREAQVWYRKQTASLAESAPHLRRLFAKEEIGLVVIDSLGAARGGEPESADSTIRLFNAARSIGLPWIGVDHMTKNGGGDQATPFGSVYTHNMARATWALELVDDGAADPTIALTNRKANNGPLQGRRAYEVAFRMGENDALASVTYTPRDVRDIPEMLGRLKLKDQITAVLKANNRAMTVADILTALEADGVTARASAALNLLQRNPDQFVQVGSVRPATWGLRASSVYAAPNSQNHFVNSREFDVNSQNSGM